MAKIYYLVGSIFSGLLAQSYGQFSTAPCYEYGPLILCASNGATYASVCDFKTAQLFYPSLKPIHKGPCTTNWPIGPSGPKKPNGPNNQNGWKPNPDYPIYDTNGKKPNVEYPDYNSNTWKPNVAYPDYDTNVWNPREYPKYSIKVLAKGPSPKEHLSASDPDPNPIDPTAETASERTNRLPTGYSSYESDADDDRFDKTFYRSDDKLRKAKHPRFVPKRLGMEE